MSKQPSRIDLALQLACAAMTVLVSGYVADKTLRTVNKRKHCCKPKPVAFGPGPLEGVDRREFRNGGKYHGIFKRVAQNLGVNPSTVEINSRGASHSKRVLDAIVAEVHRVDSDLAASPLPLPLTAPDRAEFARVRQFREAQRFRFNYSALARELGVTAQHVRRVALGLSTSARVSEAIQREIERRIKNGNEETECGQ